jgi:hypothetical protein
MSLDPHMEDTILKPKHKKKYIGLIVAAIVVVALGGMALYIRSAGISADTITPPSPSQPTSVTPPTPGDVDTATPPTPEDPTKPGQFIFPAGWSMVSAKAFVGYTLTKLEAAGIYLYSYNDPNYPTTDWTIFPGTITPNSTCTPTSTTTCPSVVAGQQISLVPRTPLGYYAYNPTIKPVSVTLDKQTAKQISDASKTATSSYGRGWHLVYWNGNALTKDQLFSKIKITYSDKSVLSGTQAIAADKHTASLKVYVVVNQNSMTSSESIKELTGTDSATTLSKMPKNSYYWIYLRRTGQRASGLGYGVITPTTSATATQDGSVPPVPSLPSE